MPDRRHSRGRRRARRPPPSSLTPLAAYPALPAPARQVLHAGDWVQRAAVGKDAGQGPHHRQVVHRGGPVRHAVAACLALCSSTHPLCSGTAMLPACCPPGLLTAAAYFCRRACGACAALFLPFEYAALHAELLQRCGTPAAARARRAEVVGRSCAPAATRLRRGSAGGAGSLIYSLRRGIVDSTRRGGHAFQKACRCCAADAPGSPGTLTASSSV